MKKLLLAASLCAGLSFASGSRADEAAPKTPDAPAANPALEKFGDAITFYASFDASAAADLSNGNGAPRDPNFQAELKPGVFGQAFLSGEKSVSYEADKNFDLSKPGAMAVWISPYQWKRDLPDTPYMFIVNIQTQGRGLMLARMGNKANREAMYLYVGGKDNFSVVNGSSLDWKDGEWHLLVINWRNGSVEFSLDGGELARKDAPEFEKAQGEPNAVFVGSTGNADQKYLLDELMVLNRPLEADEIKELWKAAPAKTEQK